MFIFGRSFTSIILILILISNNIFVVNAKTNKSEKIRKHDTSILLGVSHSPEELSVSSYFDLKPVTTGYFHSCALTQTGVKCWGFNFEGQLGNGTNISRSLPVDVLGLSSGVKSIVSGWLHTCALTVEGGVKCWGGNGNNQLGNGADINSNIPVDVVGLSSGVKAIVSGLFHTCALTTNDGVKCWGLNTNGELGDGTTLERSIPVTVVGLSSEVITFSAGGYHTCVIMIGGEAKCWGNNYYGQLGDNTKINRAYPVDVTILPNNPTFLSQGIGHSCALDSSGGVKCWGGNISGQLGNGTTIDSMVPVNVVGLNEGVVNISSLNYHSCALTQSGGIKCWGSNQYGALGDGTTINRSVPVDVVGLSSGAAFVSSGGFHTCGLLNIGELKCWGANFYGQLGDGTTISRAFPDTVIGVIGIINPILDRINSFALSSKDLINEILREAQLIAIDGDYFAVQKTKDEIETITTAFLDTINVLSGALPEVDKVKDLIKIQIPGSGVGWSNVINLRNTYNPARDLFKDALLKPVTLENAELAAKEFFSQTYIFYAADLTDTLAEELLTDTVISSALTTGFVSENALVEKHYPSQNQIAGILIQAMDNTRLDIVANLPPLSLEEQNKYIEDLDLRQKANNVLAFTLERQALPLHAAHDARISAEDNWLTTFLIKYLLRSLAFLWADGAGVMVVDMGVLVSNLFQNIQKVKEDMKFATMGLQGMAGSLDAEKKIYLNTVNGLSLITLGISPQIPRAELSPVMNYSEGECIPFVDWIWWEKASYSEVDYSNITGYSPVVQLVASYGNTGFLGASFQPMVSEGVKTIDPLSSSKVRVNYLKDGQGASPDKGSVIDFDALGSTDTGTYFIQHLGTQWNPQIVCGVTETSTQAITLSEVVTYPYPIHTRISRGTVDLTYQAHIWVNNSFTQPIQAMVSQPLPAQIQVIDPGVGTVVGSSISWNVTVDPQSSMELVFAFTYSGIPGTQISLAGASLGISDGTNSASFTADPTRVHSQLPVKGDGSPYRKLTSNQSVTIPVTLENLWSTPISGSLRLRVVDMQGNEQWNQTLQVNIPTLGTVDLQIPFTTPNNLGTKIQTVTFETPDWSYQVFSTYLDVVKYTYLPIINR